MCLFFWLGTLQCSKSLPCTIFSSHATCSLMRSSTPITWATIYIDHSKIFTSSLDSSLELLTCISNSQQDTALEQPKDSSTSRVHKWTSCHLQPPATPCPVSVDGTDISLDVQARNMNVHPSSSFLQLTHHQVLLILLSKLFSIRTATSQVQTTFISYHDYDSLLSALPHSILFPLIPLPLWSQSRLSKAQIWLCPEYMDARASLLKPRAWCLLLLVGFSREEGRCFHVWVDSHSQLCLKPSNAFQWDELAFLRGATMWQCLHAFSPECTDIFCAPTMCWAMRAQWGWYHLPWVKIHSWRVKKYLVISVPCVSPKLVSTQQ